MATLRDLRQRISSIKNTEKITAAMRVVASTKLRRAQQAIFAARPYTMKVQEILGNLAAAKEEEYFHPLMRKPKEIKNVALIVITSDRGLCGSFNTNLLKHAMQHIMHELPAEHKNMKVSVVIVGKRAASFFARTTANVVKQYPDVFAKLDFSTAEDIAALISDGFTTEKYDRVEIIYNEFKSVMRQEIRQTTLLPIEPVLTPQAQKAADLHPERVIDYIFEPTRGDIMDTLLPKYLKIQLWRALLESNAAEQAARMMAMETASKNAKDLIDNLTLSYNKARQAAITKEMLEIVGGAEALRG